MNNGLENDFDGVDDGTGRRFSPSGGVDIILRAKEVQKVTFATVWRRSRRAG